MITLAVFSLLVISSVTATPHIITSVPSNTSILILSLPFFVMPFLYGDNLYYYVIQPGCFFGAMLPIKPHIITMFALGESYAGHFVCKWGAASPPTTSNHPAFQRPWMLAKENKSSRRHH